MGQVYEVKNLKNGKLYFGKSIHSMQSRMRNHLYLARAGTGGAFHRSLAKHGKDSFEWRVVYESEVESELFSKERELIQQFKTNQAEFGYNLTAGGEGQAGRQPTEEENLRRGKAVSKYLTGKPKSEETKKKISLSLRGRTREDLVGLEKAKEEKDHKSARFSGKGNPMYGCPGTRKPGEFHHSEETKKKLSEVQRGKTLSEQTRLNMSRAHLGKKKSPQSIQKRIDTMRRKKEENEANT